MRTMFKFLLVAVFAVLPLAAFTDDNDGAQVSDGRRYKASYILPITESATLTNSARQILVRAETAWKGGYFKIRTLMSTLIGQHYNIEVYSGVRLGCTNSTALTNYWVRSATSNLGGVFIGTNGTTTYTIATCTNTNTNGNNSDTFNMMAVSKANREIYTTIGATNATGGQFVVSIPNNTSPAGIITWGSKIDTIYVTHSTTPYFTESPDYWLPADSYVLIQITNKVASLTNIIVELEFTKKK